MEVFTSPGSSPVTLLPFYHDRDMVLETLSPPLATLETAI